MTGRKNTKGKTNRGVRGHHSGSSGKKGSMNRVSYGFHVKLKHVLEDLTLFSLFAAFEVFSIPAPNGVIDL